MRERRRREWLIPFARSLTRQTARKTPPHKGCGKIGRDRVGRSSFFRRKMRPRSGLLAPHVYFSAVWHPRRCPIPAFAGPLGPRSGEPSRCAPWHRSPGYDLRRAPYDHPDFTSNALSEDLFSASLSSMYLIKGLNPDPAVDRPEWQRPAATSLWFHLYIDAFHFLWLLLPDPAVDKMQHEFSCRLGAETENMHGRSPGHR